jgi:hypothetical protein
MDPRAKADVAIGPRPVSIKEDGERAGLFKAPNGMKAPDQGVRQQTNARKSAHPLGLEPSMDAASQLASEWKLAQLRQRKPASAG